METDSQNLTSGSFSQPGKHCCGRFNLVKLLTKTSSLIDTKVLQTEKWNDVHSLNCNKTDALQGEFDA